MSNLSLFLSFFVALLTYSTFACYLYLLVCKILNRKVVGEYHVRYKNRYYKENLGRNFS